jgi:monothiol glutaredoxin
MLVKRDLQLETEVTPENARKTIEKQIAENELLIYMKGSALLPQCGFSAQTIEIFNRLNVSYRTFDVLSSLEIREAIKTFSNWPTIPQVYYQQKFIGGCDVITEMYKNGDLEALIVKNR